MRIPLLAIVVLWTSGTLPVAHAAPITYTMSGVFSGSIGATSFTDTAATFTFVGDTSATASLGAGFYTNTAGVSTITLAGLGTATFLSTTFGAESQFDGAGFYDIANGFGVSIYDPALGSYALTPSFSDTASLERSFAAGFGTTESTSMGELLLDGNDGSPATFTASQAVTTPEPGSFAMLATGLLGVTCVLRRRLV
ncbi:MAG TPA: PEP-CTERM sorting domain-containing protein [Acidobacteriaceae bacterium]|nr:PEP-CTERM sorting domain-containing protein [Acidobacteriaceae bacterium]